MAVLLAEDWTGVALGSDPADAPGWSLEGNSTGVRTIVDSPTIDGQVRSASYAVVGGSGAILHMLPGTGRTYTSWYWRWTGSSASQQFVAQLGAGGQSAHLRMLSGRLQLRDAFTAVATAAAVSPPDVWHRLEWLVDTVTQTQTLAVYSGGNLHGPTPDETIVGAYTRPVPDRIRLGPVANPSSVTYEQFYARVRVADDGHVAPYQVPSGPDPVVSVATSTLPGLGQQATATVTAPIYTATAAQALPAVGQQATGTVTAPDRPPRGTQDHTVRVGPPSPRTTAAPAVLRSRITSGAPTVSTTAGTAAARTTAGPAVLDR